MQLARVIFQTLVLFKVPLLFTNWRTLFALWLFGRLVCVLRASNTARTLHCYFQVKTSSRGETAIVVLKPLKINENITVISTLATKHFSLPRTFKLA